MKQILLLRHAKSSWDDPGLKDFDRPLAERGLRDAPLMGQFIKKAGYDPAAIFSSTATRAKQTSQLAMKAGGIDSDMIHWNEDLYYGSMSHYIDQIQAASDDHERIMLVGHNPIIENTAGILSGSDHKIAVRMPTAALVCLECFAEYWGDVSAGTCQIKWMMIPKVIKKIMGTQ
ncbi:MAG TPA: histidine phosphatase family protein [Gracilimonas sp.]|nr:histidine phosphatase family protein [Gracilimonas sp.]